MTERDESLILPASLQWRDGVPWSDRFGDVYFSRDNGIAESKHVFLQGNGLPQRFIEKEHFVIGETGFGTGRNFFLSWQQFNGKQLHYFSTERFPLSVEDICRLHANTPLAPMAEQLALHFPPLIPGLHVLKVLPTVHLYLLLGDSTEMLSRIDATIDAWYLDGFSPAVNAEMWKPELLQQIARLSGPGTTLASYSVAGQLRRDLATAGFTVQKRPGIGNKREVLTAHFASNGATSSPLPPWFHRPQASDAQRIAIIGAGIAGCATAARLNRENRQITVIDAHPHPAGEASGNPIGIVRPKWQDLMQAPDNFAAAAWAYAVHALATLKVTHPDCWHPDGVLEKCGQKEWARIENLAEDHWLRRLYQISSTSLCKEDPANPWIHFYQAGWIRPAEVCQALLDSSGATFLQRQISALTPTVKGWELIDTQGLIINADMVILCSGHHRHLLTPLGSWPVSAVPGQISVANATPVSSSHQVSPVFCEPGYVIAPPSNPVVFGATYRPAAADTAITEADHLQNLEYLRELSPSLADTLHPSLLQGRVSSRAHSPDYHPLVGGIPDTHWMQTAYGDLCHGRKKNYPSLNYLPGLFLNIGHGSRGFLNAFLSAELLAALIEGAPLPVTRKIYESLHPARFFIKALRRGQTIA